MVKMLDEGRDRSQANIHSLYFAWMGGEAVQHLILAGTVDGDENAAGKKKLVSGGV